MLLVTSICDGSIAEAGSLTKHLAGRRGEGRSEVGDGILAGFLELLLTVHSEKTAVESK